MMKSKDKVAEIEVSYKPKNCDYPLISSPEDSFLHLQKFFPIQTISLQEKFVVGYLNRANRLIGVYEVSKGGITGTVADPRLILGVALKSAATGIILCHNHPSGNLQPSAQDKALTSKIKDACVLLEISLLDHMILAPSGKYYSFSEEGIL